MLPTLFISHGSPQLAIMEHDVADFLQKLPNKFEKPKYIIIVSAHWTSDNLKILVNENPTIIYDFYGFPKELYQVEYPVENDIKYVNKVYETIKSSKIDIEKDESRIGYDHGVWAPLSLMYKDADIPVVQLSLPIHFSGKKLMQIGAALQSLRDEALIIGSGNMTHNLFDSQWEDEAPIKEYAREFRDWVVKNIENKNEDLLVDLINQAPYCAKNHPSLDHLLPFFVAYGASKGKTGIAMNDVYMYANQSMEMVLFKD
ncbi:DODA-type extradiol aromatic ring-opening family dioxygenase [Sulfurospirillum arcachonense]|uniref:DODA-type extradiol aromatic ring-opening family dioxygenase n=1 Tax=Sulfurospirillum arcachonense TaxID=57666 RepID=UPI00046900CD|nr:class III extradiol ring-cleavage dioxygenase [Sulfurospirillum arcachonense]